MRKPNWDNAPAWANYWAIDKSGKAYWYEFEPLANSDFNRWITKLGKYEADLTMEGWENTLEKKPIKEKEESDANIS